jgi:catalase
MSGLRRGPPSFSTWHGLARKEVQMLQLCHFFRADEDYGRRVAEKLGLEVVEVEPPPPQAAATV